MIQRVFRENVDAQNVRLDLFLQLLGRMFDALDGYHMASTQLTLLFASVLKIQQAGRTVQMVAGKGYVEEILSISRTLVEVTVNAAYFQYASPQELDLFIQFQPEAAYRRDGGKLALGSGDVVPGVLSTFRRLLKKSQPPSSTEPSWTRTTLMARAQMTDEMSHIPIMMPLVARCYPRGHAAIHGTMGSLQTFVTQLASSSAPVPEERLAGLAEALFSVNLCLLTLCMYLNAYLDLAMDEAIDEAANANAKSRPGILGG